MCGALGTMGTDRRAAESQEGAMLKGGPSNRKIDKDSEIYITSGLPSTLEDNLPLLSKGAPLKEKTFFAPIHKRSTIIP